MNGDRIPQVEIGQIVYWWDSGDTTQPPRAALVTGMGLDGRRLNLNIFEPQSYNTRVRDGVLHVRDPRANKHDFIEDGAWDLTPRDKRLDLLMGLLEEKASQPLAGAAGKK